MAICFGNNKPKSPVSKAERLTSALATPRRSSPGVLPVYKTASLEIDYDRIPPKGRASKPGITSRSSKYARIQMGCRCRDMSRGFRFEHPSVNLATSLVLLMKR